MKTDRTSLGVRAYSGPKDLQAMIGLLVRVRLPDRLADSPGIVDLQELLSMPDVQADTRLWFDGNELAAFAFVDPFNNLRFEALPEVIGALESAAVSWGEECILRRPHDPGERVTLDASCREEDTARIAMLQRHGFEALPVRSLHLVRALGEPIPEPTLPPGFAIRAVTGLDEAEALAALHRAAFDTEYMTTERRLAMMTTPEHDPSLDLVAVAPGGALAAYCMCSISADENARTGRKDGYADPVATHPRFQWQGLARALLLHGLRLLKTRGMDFARLGTSSDNAAMQRAAESVGFHVESAICWFEKPIGETCTR